MLVYSFACEAAGASRARHFLRPHLPEGRTIDAQTRAKPRRGNVFGCLKIESNFGAVVPADAGTRNHKCPCGAALERLSRSELTSVVMGPGVRRDDEWRERCLP